MADSSPLPWRKPRRESLMLVLVGLVALTLVYGPNAQDNSRLCLAQAITHGRLTNDGCFALDHSRYHGHDYSDKAPGLSLVEIPVMEAVQLQSAARLPGIQWKVWLIRILTVGIPYLVLVFLIGRISEGLAPGFGSIAMVTFALGTLVMPFAGISFDQVPSGLLGFGAFLLAWRRKPLAAGLAAGAAVVFEYETGLIVVVLALYLLADSSRWRSLARFAAGIVPGALVLAAYDWLAFGAPWRLSYRYVANQFHSEQQTGFFGIGLPHWLGSYEVFAGDGGLLAVSPVVLAAAWGLVLLGRRFPREALVCAAVTTLFVFANCGYFLTYGGSPGPRFLVPALPFLALGLAPAFAWRPRLTTALAFFSIVSVVARSLVWGDQLPLRGGVWGELARVPSELDASSYVQHLEFTVVDWIVPGRSYGAILEIVLAVIAFSAALATVPKDQLQWRRRPSEPQRRRPGVPAKALVLAGVCIVAAAQASEVFGYPYGIAKQLQGITLSIIASKNAAFVDQEVDFTLVLANHSAYQGYGQVYLTIHLPPGMRLLGRPYYEIGQGCRGTRTVSCFLEDLSPNTSTPVRFGVEIVRFGDQTLAVGYSAQGVPPQPLQSFTVGSTPGASG